MASIESAVAFMEAIAKDDSHGYDQAHRNDGVDYDCSSLVGTALNQAGFNVKKASTTRTLKAQLLACGFKSIGINETRKRGDIFLKEGHHVVMCVDAKNIVHASINENGKTTGGKPGDQTGKEICVRSFYTYKGGWGYHFRYDQPAAAQPTQTVTIGNGDDWVNRLNAEIKRQGFSTYPTVKKGAKGNITKLIQERLNSVGFHLKVDGDFGKNTYEAVIVFQRNRGLTQDGIVGKNTWSYLLSGKSY